MQGAVVVVCPPRRGCTTTAIPLPTRVQREIDRIRSPLRSTVGQRAKPEAELSQHLPALPDLWQCILRGPRCTTLRHHSSKLHSHHGRSGAAPSCPLRSGGGSTAGRMEPPDSEATKVGICVQVLLSPHRFLVPAGVGASKGSGGGGGGGSSSSWASSRVGESSRGRSSCSGSGGTILPEYHGLRAKPRVLV